MYLETEAGQRIDDPTSEQIRRTLSSLGPKNSFATLGLSDESDDYIQATADGKTFTVEYCEARRQWQSANPAVSFQEVAEMFMAYNRGDEAWRTMTDWQDITADRAGPRWAKLLLVAVLGLLVLAAVLLYLSTR
jgi:phage host-nuclease inhibitor protein Gam